MSVSKQIAKHLRETQLGGNWTGVTLKDALQDVDWRRATAKVQDLNTIAALVFHINYYVGAILKVLQGGSLQASDKFSFDLPPVTSEDDWRKLVNKMFAEAQQLADLIENLDDGRLDELFADLKYGNYYRNLTGLIEHTHYHLGQIVLIKKMLIKQGAD